MRLITNQIKYIERQLAKARQEINSTAIRANIASVANETNMANMANAVNNYWPHSTGLKNQLTGIDTTAYAPWKWAVKEKLRIDAIIYPTKIDRVSHAFSQLMQFIFQQLEA